MLNEHIKPKSPFFLDTLNMEHRRNWQFPDRSTKLSPLVIQTFCLAQS